MFGRESFRLIVQHLRTPGVGVKVRSLLQRSFASLSYPHQQHIGRRSLLSGCNALYVLMFILLWLFAAVGAIDVLVAVPYDDIVPCPVREKMFEALARLECGSGSKFNLHLGLVDDWEPTLPEDLGRRAAIARLRNHLLDKFLKPEQCASPSKRSRLYQYPHCVDSARILTVSAVVYSEYVLWLDGGVVEYPEDLVAKLHGVNPDGVTAPLVLVDGSDSMQYHQRFCGAVNCGGSFVSARSHKLHDPRGFFVAGRPVRRTLPSYSCKYFHCQTYRR
eukprot:COSAG02_NODE_860_length_16430_cov_39.045741_6_plen_276_part_00